MIQTETIKLIPPPRRGGSNKTKKIIKKQKRKGGSENRLNYALFFYKKTVSKLKDQSQNPKFKIQN
jgi:hypothetical protein